MKIITLILWVINPALAFAQPTFRLLSTAGSYSDLFYEVAPGKPPVPINLNQTPSRPYPRPVSGTLRLYREIPPPPSAPPGTKPTRHIVLTLALSDAPQDDLVVTAPKNRDFSTRNLTGVVLPGTPEPDVPGSLRVLNFSTHTVGMKMGRQLHEFPAGADNRVTLPSGNLRVLFRVAVHDKKNRWQQVQKNERRLSPHHRGYLVVTDFLDDPDYDRNPTPPPIRIQLFFEFAPAALLTNQNVSDT